MIVDVNNGASFYAQIVKTIEASNAENQNIVSYQQIIKEKIEEQLEKLRNGELEPSYPIGAATFTEKEWDTLLKRFDITQEIIREAMKEYQEKQEAEHLRKEELEKKFEEEQQEIEVDILVAESTICSYPSAAKENEDEYYITWYTKEGIFCRKAGQTTGYEWMIPFEDEAQYDKVIAFIRQFSEEKNLRFAACERFWVDFLNGDLDERGAIYDESYFIG